MGRAIGGVISAFVLWTVLWLGFNQIAAVALPEIIVTGQPLTHTGVLIACIIYSVVISVVAGFVCASVKKESPMKTVWVFALIQLPSASSSSIRIGISCLPGTTSSSWV